MSRRACLEFPASSAYQTQLQQLVAQEPEKKSLLRDNANQLFVCY
jgi:hypothetical protein